MNNETQFRTKHALEIRKGHAFKKEMVLPANHAGIVENSLYEIFDGIGDSGFDLFFLIRKLHPSWKCPLSLEILCPAAYLACPFLAHRNQQSDNRFSFGIYG